MLVGCVYLVIKVTLGVAATSGCGGPFFGFCFLDLDCENGRPVNHAGRTQALRSGETGKDAGLAALGQGWPIAATRCAMPERGHTEPGRGAEWWGKSALVTLRRAAQALRK